MIPLKKFTFTPQTFKSRPRTSTPSSFNPRTSTVRQFPKVPKVEVPKVVVPKVKVPKVVVPEVPKVEVPEVPKVEVSEVHERGDEPLTWNMGKRKISVPRSSCGLIAPPNSPRETWKDREIMTVYDRFKLLGKPTIDHWSQLDCFTEKDKAEGWTLESWDNFKWMDIEKEDYPGYSDEMELINNDQAESKVQSNQTSPTYLKCQVPPPIDLPPQDASFKDAEPNVETSNGSAPNIETLNVAAKNVSMPNVAARKIGIPKDAATKVATPNVETPNVETPNVAAPNVETLNVTTPNVAAPNVALEKLPSPKHAFLKEKSPINASQHVFHPELVISKEMSPENTPPTYKLLKDESPSLVPQKTTSPRNSSPTVFPSIEVSPRNSPPNVTAPQYELPKLSRPKMSPLRACLKKSPRTVCAKVCLTRIAHPKHQGHVISSSYSGGDINLQRSSENPPPYHEDEQFDIDDHFKQLEEIDKRIAESDKKLQMYMDEMAKLEAETKEIYKRRQNKKAQKTGENNEEDDKTPSRGLMSTASRWILKKWPVVLGLFATVVITCL